MKFSIFSILLVSIFVFSSCEKGNYFKDKWDKEGKDEWIKDGDDKTACFDLVYPITYIMPDGSTVTGGDEKEMWTAVKAWYEAHLDSVGKPVLQYPVDIMFKDETTQTIDNDEEMILAKKDCFESEIE